jgi:hypothetical protein
MEGVERACLFLEPVVDEAFRFEETNTNRFIQRDNSLKQ